MEPTRPVEARAAGFRETIVTVLWSFLGIRKRSDHDRVATRLNPVYVVAAGVLATAVFVLVLILIVHGVVK